MPSIAHAIRRIQAATIDRDDTRDDAAVRLRRLDAFGANPGALDGWFYAPDDVRNLALVVVLHGCTQTAAQYDVGSGWSDLAERYGFAVLFPEQRRANNANRCFNWFLPDDTTRGAGEAASIRQMIDAVAQRLPIDPTRVFVTGLSAGGAMANAMLATYPETFAGGSLIAGLPYGAATSVPQALERMRGQGIPTEAAAAAAVRRASAHRGPWPTVTVWHGDADRTVAIANADAIVGQWRALHGTGAAPDRSDTVDGQRHRTWLDDHGRAAVEEYRIAGFGHGTPLKTQGAASCGVAGAHMMEAGISSTWRQAERWNLLGTPRVAAERAPASVPHSPSPRHDERPAPASGVGAIIENALRAAGLMR